MPVQPNDRPPEPEQRLRHTQRLAPIQVRLLPHKPAHRPLAPHPHHHIPRRKVGALVRLPGEDQLAPLRQAAVDRERQLGDALDDPVALARRAGVLDRLPAAGAGVALHLDLLEHARPELVPDEADAPAFAGRALVDVFGRARARAVAFVADLLARDGDLQSEKRAINQHRVQSRPRWPRSAARCTPRRHPSH